MNKKEADREAGAEINALNRLFGRDLAAGGWTVTPKAAAESPREGRETGRRSSDIGPDPAIIWALRGRKR